MTLTHTQLQPSLAATAAKLCVGTWASLEMVATAEYPAQKPNFDALPSISRGDDRTFHPPS